MFALGNSWVAFNLCIGLLLMCTQFFFVNYSILNTDKFPAWSLSFTLSCWTKALHCGHKLVRVNSQIFLTVNYFTFFCLFYFFTFAFALYLFFYLIQWKDRKQKKYLVGSLPLFSLCCNLLASQAHVLDFQSSGNTGRWKFMSLSSFLANLIFYSVFALTLNFFLSQHHDLCW